MEERLFVICRCYFGAALQLTLSVSFSVYFFSYSLGVFVVLVCDR